jgi:hypothetical protein
MLLQWQDELATKFGLAFDIIDRDASDGPSSSSSTARRGSTRRLPPCGTACRSSGARSTSTGTCSRMRLSACMTKSTAGYTDMIYAATREEIEACRKAFIRKWRLKHRAVADSLEEAGDRLFTFTRLPPSQWRSARTTNAIERLHEEFKRRIKTQTVLPSADTAAMLFWALLASGQINMRKVDGWQTLATTPIDQPIDLAA